MQIYATTTKNTKCIVHEIFQYLNVGTASKNSYNIYTVLRVTLESVESSLQPIQR